MLVVVFLSSWSVPSAVFVISKVNAPLHYVQCSLPAGMLAATFINSHPSFFFCNNTLSFCLFFIPMLNYSFFLFDGVNCVSYVAHWNPKSHSGVIQASMLTHTVSPCRVDVFFLSAPRSLWGCGRVLSSSATSNGLFSCELHSYLLLIRGITISNASHHK